MMAMIRTRRVLARLVAAMILFAGTSLAAAGATDNAAPAHGVTLSCGGQQLHVSVVAPGVLRVERSFAGTVPVHHSWAVMPRAVQHPPAITHVATANAVGFDTARLQVRIDRRTLALTVTDAAGHLISADAPGWPVSHHGHAFEVYQTLPAGAHIFGLGDKTGPLDHRGRAFTLWNTDAYHWQASTDPLYKSIPFFIQVSGDRAHGVFLDDTYRSHFDFGQRTRNVLSFGAEGGPIDYYLIAGPTPAQVLTRYTALTGRPPMMPRWVLGYQQSRWSYGTQAEVMRVAKRLRADHIPADTLFLDIDYQNKDRTFTIDKQAFPHFAQMIAQLHRMQFHVVAITDLAIPDAKPGQYAVRDSGLKHDVFVKRADGSHYLGDVWGGPSFFPDFTNQAAARWWGRQYAHFYQDLDIDGFWNDMNEPSIFNVASKTMPLDNRDRIVQPGWAERTTTQREIHNVFGMLNSRATYRGLLKLKPDLRPYVLTRDSYAGGQRYAATWTGDNSATWDHMRISTPQLMNLGLSGFAFAGDDIGGYAGSPPADLLTRWIELGAFNPIMRDHTEKYTRPQEPWVDGARQEAIRRHYIQARYRLLPYLYTLAEQAHRTGLPMMRPLFLNFPNAANLNVANDSEFMLGGDLLVAPAPFPEQMDGYTVSFPKGSSWYDYWSGKRVMLDAHGQLTLPHPALDTLPVFVRAGAIVPRQPLVQSTAQTPQGALELDVYPGADCHGEIYTDDGKSFAFRHGHFYRRQFRCKMLADGRVQVSFAAPKGDFKPWWHRVDISVFGAAHGPRHLELARPAGARTVTVPAR
ncbi:glycoside hydrolase family 31 protein [Oleiagrimonas sp. C23AA]|uniref:glycoside hydrolase family 31 protein n=1 Tax=Oleiagrimonas sp. C23AA TaxID=2719047 RepID=UPI00141E8F66|nr:glycoside hydrolase family 31 protein [Oleiagrimonas sp. C23AA]NII10774.1 glycoside hydrolase family 31 protein [Oleiagrimonas sp. C23AA]